MLTLLQYQYKKKTALLQPEFVFFFWIFPLWVPTYSGNLRSWKKNFWGQRGLAFEIRRGPKNAERHEGKNAVANIWRVNFFDLRTLGDLNPATTKFTAARNGLILLEDT